MAEAEGAGEDLGPVPRSFRFGPLVWRRLLPARQSRDYSPNEVLNLKRLLLVTRKNKRSHDAIKHQLLFLPVKGDNNLLSV